MTDPTPDTAALRKKADKRTVLANEVRALCDALDAARAEIERLTDEVVRLAGGRADAQIDRDHARDRAERAEAEVARLANQVRHWKEQEAKQRRLRAEEGRWKHRALAAEAERDRAKRQLDVAQQWAKDYRDQRDSLRRTIEAVEALMDVAENCDGDPYGDGCYVGTLNHKLRAALAGEAAPPAEPEQLCAKHCTLASCRKAVCIVFEQRADDTGSGNG